MAGHYEILVSNMGVVFESDNGFVAHTEFRRYVGKSKRSDGRAAGEDVTLMRDGDILQEFAGSLSKEEVHE